MTAPPNDLHGLQNRNLPLCISCGACGHRALIEAFDLAQHGSGPHRPATLSDVSRRLVCRHCRGRAVTISVPKTRREAKRFIDAVRQ